MNIHFTVEEMQQELMDAQGKTTKQEREISSLKMKLEEVKLKRKDEVAKLKEQISVLEEGKLNQLFSFYDSYDKHNLKQDSSLFCSIDRVTTATKYPSTTR